MAIEGERRLLLYGAFISRPFRVCWMLNELGLDYEHVNVLPDSADEAAFGARSERYKRINPNGRIPTLQDGDFVLWETAAINLYLVQKYGDKLRPDTCEGFARALQWSFFMSNDVEPRLVEIRRMRFKTAPEHRDEQALRVAEQRLAGPLQIIDEALGKTGYLQGDAWGLADFMVASTLYALAQFDYHGFLVWPRLSPWLANSLGRPAALEALKLYDTSIA